MQCTARSVLLLTDSFGILMPSPVLASARELLTGARRRRQMASRSRWLQVGLGQLGKRARFRIARRRLALGDFFFNVRQLIRAFSCGTLLIFLAWPATDSLAGPYQTPVTDFRARLCRV